MRFINKQSIGEASLELVRPFAVLVPSLLLVVAAATAAVYREFQTTWLLLLCMLALLLVAFVFGLCRVAAEGLSDRRRQAEDAERLLTAYGAILPAMSAFEEAYGFLQAQAGPAEKQLIDRAQELLATTNDILACYYRRGERTANERTTPVDDDAAWARQLENAEINLSVCREEISKVKFTA